MPVKRIVSLNKKKDLTTEVTEDTEEERVHEFSRMDTNLILNSYS
jgi:hypothetical protein